MQAVNSVVESHVYSYIYLLQKLLADISRQLYLLIGGSKALWSPRAILSHRGGNTTSQHGHTASFVWHLRFVAPPTNSVRCKGQQLGLICARATLSVHHA